jgi:precorrin-3B synthase
LARGVPAVPAIRDRRDRCPGALRPWPAGDGQLVRLRLIGGRVRSEQLDALVEVAETFGDGRIHITSRANLQIRGLPGADGDLDPAALGALVSTGLVPSRTHELVRNVMVSPQSGLAGGRTDLRNVAAELDRLLCANGRLAELPGRFLFVLDDGRGDLRERSCDLGLVALDDHTVQLRVGAGWGPTVTSAGAASRLADLADLFLDARGQGPTAPWHVAELDEPLVEPAERDARLPEPIEPLPFGDVPAGLHLRVPEAGLDRTAVTVLTRNAPEVVVTPWRGVLVPKEKPSV